MKLLFSILLTLLLCAACGDSSSGGSGESGNAAPPAPEDSPIPADAPPIPEDLLTLQEFAPSSASFLNPERGFFWDIDPHDTAEKYTRVREKGYSLAFADIPLEGYETTDLDDAFLATLDFNLGRVRAAGIKLALRCRYIHDHTPTQSDAPLSWIERHIEQLKPLFQKYADIILVVQAGFIGADGEWHDSSNGLDNPASRAAVLDALLAAIPPGVPLQVRRPKFKTDFLGAETPLAADLAFGTDPAARIGHHNDCFLASATDEGTYPSKEIETWKQYVAEDSRFVPVGGETCKANPPRSECAEALAEMGRLHWSFLNVQWQQDVINGWKAGGCYEEIAAHLGYRLALRQARWNKAVAPGGVLYLDAAIANEGYAAPFRERPLYAVISREGACYAARIEADPRRFEPGQSTFYATITMPADAAPGSWRLAFWLPDEDPAIAADPRYAIRLANDGVWDDTKGWNILTEDLSVDAAAPAVPATAQAEFTPCP